MAPAQILVVEDNDRNMKLVREVLHASGYRTLEATSGGQAVEVAAESRPDLVLMDIQLPDIDGVEVCRRVRQLPLDYRPVMAALTGWGMDEDRRRTREAGFDHHFVKPVAPEQLDALLAGAPVGNR